MSDHTATLTITVHAPTAENAGQWAQTIADHVYAEHGRDMRLDIQHGTPPADGHPPTAHDVRGAIPVLRRAESYLSALHTHTARHDNLAANFGCAGCELRDRITRALAVLTSTSALR